MPSLTPKQHRAMEAAAHGKSTLGIPKSVGQEFVQADKEKMSLADMTNPKKKRKKGVLESMSG